MSAGDEQSRLWNGPAGRAWVDTQDVLDRALQPFADLLVDALPAGAQLSVLDVGCGTGGTTVELARRVGAAGRLVGVDISAPMIDAARARAAREGVDATFICASAETYPFEPQRFDEMVSRFGVMFFDDPVRAFANLRAAATPQATLRFIAWRSIAENPFMTTAERAAAPLLPNLPPRRPGPGQFSFADRDRVQAILDESGWTGIDIQPIDVVSTLPERDLETYATRLGPVGIFLQDTDPATRDRVVEVVLTAFQRYVHGSEVRFTNACWMVTARPDAARGRG